MLQELPYEKRDGARVADAYLYALTYDLDKSTSEACSLLNQLYFLPATAQALKDDAEMVIKHLNEARQFCKSRAKTLLKPVLDPSIMRVSVRGDVLGLAEPRSALARSLFPNLVGPTLPGFPC